MLNVVGMYSNKHKYKNFVITRTPLRISFFGGGSDILDYYNLKKNKKEYGAVINGAINKYVYVSIKRHEGIFFEKYRLNYSKTELVRKKSDIKNKIIKSCLKVMKINEPLYISTISDFPSGSGLGSSSSFCVGLLKGLHHMYNLKHTKKSIAELASYIEIKYLNQPIGKQDQYAAAFGGINYFYFKKKNVTQITQNKKYSFIKNNIYLIWTNLSRDATLILKKQKKSNQNKIINLIRAKAIFFFKKKNI
jgi:D-glycero-alpha-D-manno-heptose-7-phosphate kinase